MRTIGTLALALLLAGTGMAAAQDRGAVIATDYNTTAYVKSHTMEAPYTVPAGNGQPVHHDAVMRWHDGLLYVINRGGADNIQVLDPEQGFDTVQQYSLGLGRNVQDLAWRGDGTAYVSCYDTTELLHIDPADGTILAVISTATFADADGLPETGWLLMHGGRLFITCQRLDRDNWYAPVGDSYLLVLDPDTHQWVDCDAQQAGTQGILLSYTNPYTSIDVDGDVLVVGCVGNYGMQDGGVDRVDPEQLVSLGGEVTEAELGGDLIDVAVTGATRHILVADAGWVTHLKRYAPGAGVATIHTGTGYDHADLAFDGDFQLVVADRAMGASGLRVFDTESGAQLTSGPVSTGLPPAFIALPSSGGVVGVVDVPASPLAMSAPWPNPANPATRIQFVAGSGQTLDLRVVDLRGRVVRQARITADAEGRGAWSFDGRDQHGREVASGVYRCVVQTAAGFAARSFTIVR